MPEAAISVHAIRLHCWRYRLSGLFFHPLGSQFRLLDSSPASITEALEEARSLYLAFRSQLLERHHLQLILDQFDKAVITLDDTGALLHYNKYASQLFKINASGEIYDASFLKQVLLQERQYITRGKKPSARKSSIRRKARWWLICIRYLRPDS
ncbi:Propionate catabolism operon regulatory protein PrpR [Salmonella enterica subsp. enterica]|uniref:Propionate catabolism operon regulatory protein PrpR n=1 Tax=Salmonella enterica I TaxID=59201 RepID=A0A379WYS4_SALET|nr:Propionate catabolism operon regulatory protein PrpR [Salmonella enterica subsp. enterica]